MNAHTPNQNSAATALERLTELMRRLRDPVDGCPWDLAQTPATIAPYTIEEAYEVQDAIERNDAADVCDELGDLLLQVVFQAQLADEAGAFRFEDVANAITDKMIRRHPYIFGDNASKSAGLIPGAWEAIKAVERLEKSQEKSREKPDAQDTADSALDGVATTLPAIARAHKLQRRAARIGFDFPDWRGALAKTHEELLEVVKAHPDEDELADEVGDLLFAAVNLSRKLGIEPEAALKAANAKFETRFRKMETDIAATGQAAADLSLDQQEAAWQSAKRALKQQV